MAIAKRKKRFFDVEIPSIGKTTQLQAYELEELKGRLVDYDLTRILRGKNAILQTKVIIENGEATTYPRKLHLLPAFMKRMVRKGTNYVEDSFSTNCADAQLRLKPFLVTRRKVSRAVRTALRNKTKEELVEYCKNKTTEAIFDDILQNKLQKSLSIKLKKIYPLSLCEMRIIIVEKEFNVPKVPVKKEKKVIEILEDEQEEIPIDKKIEIAEEKTEKKKAVKKTTKKKAEKEE